MLIEECDNVSDVIELAVQFNINDDLIWDEILLKSLHQTDKINQLLDFVDQYKKPKLIVQAYDKNVKLIDVRDSLINAFTKLKLYILLLKSSINVSKKSKLENFDSLNISNCEGLKNIHNECDFCKE